MRVKSRESRRLVPYSAGFTMLEVLVALVVLAVGVLGLARLTIDGLRGTRTALLHSSASFLVADAADRIRANPGAALAYGLAGGVELAEPAFDCTSASACTPDALAQRDLYEWQRAVLGQLPAAETSITVTAVGTPSRYEYRIRIRWTDPADGAATQVALTVQA